MAKREDKGTTRVGYVNKNEQVNLGRTKPPRAGSDHGQYVYVMRCMKCHKNYGANGSDIFERKCLFHQGGKLGLKLLSSEIHKTIYYYGSRPANNYDYKRFVKSIAPILPKDDRVFLYRHSYEWRENPNKIPVVLFKNICHWKSPRRFENVLINEVSEVNKRWKNALHQLNGAPFQEHAIRFAFKELTSLHGVAVPTASALLTAWNPYEFGIIDFRVLKVLDIDKKANIDSYTIFRHRLLKLRKELKLDNCSLRQIELAIWHYYPIQNAGARTRPDN